MKAFVPESNGAKITIPNVSERRCVHIINPAAGSSRYFMAAKNAVEKSGAEMIVSTRSGNITEIVRELFTKDPFAHAVIYGGDGSVYEAVNGIMQSGANLTASFSLIKSGSGNDFSSYANESGIFKTNELNRIDLIKTLCGGETRYYVNMMNIGFDCSVVRETYTLKQKPLLHGNSAYIAGVAKVLMCKKSIPAKISLEGAFRPSSPEDVCEMSFDKDILLTACANAQYCGGGFRAAPISSITDGFMDVLVINNLPVTRFVSLVGAYKSGSYIDENGHMEDKFTKVIDYIKCRKMTIEGPEYFCLDGEIYDTGENRTVEAEVVHDALWFAAI